MFWLLVILRMLHGCILGNDEMDVSNQSSIEFMV